MSKRLLSITNILLIMLLAGCSGNKSAGNSNTASARQKVVGGKVLATDLQVTNNANDETQPAIAYDTINSRYLVVWTDYRNGAGNTEIFGKLCNATVDPGSVLHSSGMWPRIFRHQCSQ